MSRKALAAGSVLSLMPPAASALPLTEMYVLPTLGGEDSEFRLKRPLAQYCSIEMLFFVFRFSFSVSRKALAAGSGLFSMPPAASALPLTEMYVLPPLGGEDSEFRLMRPLAQYCSIEMLFFRFPFFVSRKDGWNLLFGDGLKKFVESK